MTLNDALQWAEENCSMEATERLRSRAVVSRLAGEVIALRQILAGVFDELNGCGHSEDMLENTHFCGRCGSPIDPNAALRKLILAALSKEGRDT